MGNSSSRSFSPNSSKNCPPTSDSCTVKPIEEHGEYVEGVVCSAQELRENEMKSVELGEEGRVLLVRQNGVIHALGAKCTHYGAPLSGGALGEGRVRCPWHGACFNIATGDIEDFPGFDSLPCFQVTLTDTGDVKVRARRAELAASKRVRDMTGGGGAGVYTDEVAVVVGGGPSGATCAETLRAEGWRGRVVLVAKEPRAPYDRIKVSKIGTFTDFDKLRVRSDDYYRQARIELLTGVEATALDTDGKLVRLSNGTSLAYTRLYLATGSKPRVPAIPGVHLPNVFTVRNYDDAIAILEAVGGAKDKRVVVLGLSFIGLECAASLVDKAKSVTCVGTARKPLAHVFGDEIGNRFQQLFEEKGVTFELETTITKVTGDKVVQAVELGSGRTLAADVLILGVGTTLYTEFLQGSGVRLGSDGAVEVDERLQTSARGVFAGGDIACAPVTGYGGARACVGHVGLAQSHGRLAALNMLDRNVPVKVVPFFWTMLFGKSVRYAGFGRHTSVQLEGSLPDMKFVVFFFADEPSQDGEQQQQRVVAVASCMRDPVVAQFAELTHQGKKLYKKDLASDPFAWVTSIH